MNSAVFENYDFKKKIEKLIIWFLPVFILSTLTNALLTQFLKTSISEMVTTGKYVENGETIFMLVGYAVQSLDNIVVSIWLYFQAKELKYNKALWPIWGLFQIHTALIAFIGVTLFSQHNEKSSNKLINRTENASVQN